ncbi:MORN Repeat Containing 1 protein [Trypanosoma conorhini]|uniref:MORN Repeat Containing 1 protein n=1 Tax=Trypanosoma conorhini TaxID=83891 RepID=A0A422P290_9TRYP|nr:MORN Repeat Containing 1 protein [Trypanosoma conorhini]RNF11809.1 MORN Repeat Containing 1 protein [Trypanosoma conorhini]
MSSERYTWNRNFPNGDRYNGEAIEGNIKDGKGEYFWAASGATYVGMWSQDKPHGKGTYTVPGEAGYTYEGDFVRGERSGKGVCIFLNGRRYEGEWLGDKMHGQGKLFGAEGVDDFVEYTGPFVNGERSGVNGECRYVNGNVYRGAWLHDKLHGHGDLQLDRTSSTPGYTPRMGDPHIVAYKGEFQDDAPKGMGEFLYSDGSSYRGECAGFSRHGKGEHRTVKGDSYKGSFQLDRRCGKGVLHSKAGVYDGEWQDDLLEGHLSFRGDAAVSAGVGLVFYEGPCVRGEMTGNDVVAKYRDGSSYTGAMVAGKPNGTGVLDKKRMTIPGIGEVLLRYEGEFMGGVPKGSGRGVFTLVTPDPRPAPPPPLSVEVRGFIPRLDLSGQYTGAWVSGLPNGDGEWEWEHGQSYRGALKAGAPHGSGVFKSEDADYEGSFLLGLPDGQGKICWKGFSGSEERYEGAWKEGHLDGEGTLIQNDGSKYSGGWKKGVKEGHGVDSVVGNYSYSGEFKSGKRNGQGKIRLEREGYTYEGEFVMDELTGDGKMTLDDGTVMLGGFLNGKPNGTVEIRLPTLGVFRGEFKNGKVVGTGTLLYPNGDKYEGEFIDSGKPLPLRHGKGVYTFIEGNVLECTWKRNVLHGDGVYTTATGDRSTRSYIDGVLRAPSSTNVDVFTPENEFPNTLSEEALRERQQQQQENKRHLVSIRRSLPRRTSQEKVIQRNISQAMHSIGKKNSPGVSPKASDATPSVAVPPSRSSPHPFPRKSPSISLDSGGLKGENPARSAAAAAAGTRVRGKEGGSGTGDASTQLISRFQDGISELLRCPRDTEEKKAQINTTVLSSEGNKELMQKASEIRDSREDEIHQLTEQLRQLNERIWQLSFMLQSPVTVGNEEATSTEVSRLDHLHSLKLERRSIVEKLSDLVR